MAKCFVKCFLGPSFSNIVLDFEQELRLRACTLNCLTTHYAELWEMCFDPSWNHDTWAKQADEKLYFDSTRGRLIYSITSSSQAGVYVVALP